MKKLTIYLIQTIFLLTILAGKTLAQSEGTYQGQLELGGQKLELILTLQNNDNQWMALLDIPQQGAKKLPANETKIENNQIKLDWTNFGFSIYGNFINPATIDGQFHQADMSFPLTLTKSESSLKENKKIQTPISPFPYSEEEVSFINNIDKNKITGTLTLPKSAQPNTPIVVLISGSGQQDRNSTLFEHEPFLVLADYLTRHGIGVLRYDDRGMGKSDIGPNIQKVTSENFKQDAVSAVQFLRTKGFKNIGLIGHSEGGMIAQLIAAQHPEIKFSIYMAGPGVSGGDILIGQSYAGALALGADENGARLNQQLVKVGVEAVLVNKDSTQIYNDVYKSISSMKEYEGVDKDILNTTTLQVITPLLTPWMKYFINYDPKHFVPQIKSPILALYGSKDFQVIAADNHSNMSRMLLNQNKLSKSQILPNLNHLFQPSQTGSMEEYQTNEITLDPAFLNLTKDWILSVSKQ